MRISRATQHALGFAASFAILTACSGSQSRVGPSTGTLPSATRPSVNVRGPGTVSPVSYEGNRTTHRDLGKSWMSPGAKARPSLLYITNQGNGTATVYTYSNGSGLALQGTLTGFQQPTQPCVDRAGDVFIPDYLASTITEYAHGGTTPIAVLTDPFGLPTGCSVDKISGNLAVANLAASISGGQGDVLIYPNASGTPTQYTDSSIYSPEYCGYDNRGNLFIDGKMFSSSVVNLAELPSGGSSFTDLTLAGGSITFPGNVQWGGTYLLVGDQGSQFASIPSSVNQVTVSGSTATIVHNLQFPGSLDVTGFWKRGGATNAKIIAADIGNNNAPIYTFPGLSLFATVTNGVTGPFGTVVSQQGASQ
jgi:hypothetical protein